MRVLERLDTTYAPFSTVPEYVGINRGFVDRLNLVGVRRFLDIACGNGGVSRLLLARCPRAHLNGVDIDPVQVDLALREFYRQGYAVCQGFALLDEYVAGKPVIVLGVAGGDALPYPPDSFDCVVIANAIHVMPDKPAFVHGVRRVCRPGGLFAFSSSFYAGCYPAGTEDHIVHWIREATRFIDRLNDQRRRRGEEPVRRVHGTTRGAFRNRWYSPREWTDLLAAEGFTVRSVHEEIVHLTADALSAVGAYGGLAEVLLSGYPVDVASLALRETARASLDAMRRTTLPRKWLEVVAVKTEK